MKQFNMSHGFVIVGYGQNPKHALDNAQEQVLKGIHINNDFSNVGILFKNEISVETAYTPGRDPLIVAKEYVRNMGHRDITGPAHAYLLSNNVSTENMHSRNKTTFEYLFFGRY